MKRTVATPKVGQRVAWKAASKVARLDGIKGKIIVGVVTAVDELGVYVKADAGQFAPGSLSSKMAGSLISVRQVIPVPCARCNRTECACEYCAACRGYHARPTWPDCGTR